MRLTSIAGILAALIGLILALPTVHETNVNITLTALQNNTISAEFPKAQIADQRNIHRSNIEAHVSTSNGDYVDSKASKEPRAEEWDYNPLVTPEIKNIMTTIGLIPHEADRIFEGESWTPLTWEEVEKKLHHKALTPATLACNRKYYKHPDLRLKCIEIQTTKSMRAMAEDVRNLSRAIEKLRGAHIKDKKKKSVLKKVRKDIENFMKNAVEKDDDKISMIESRKAIRDITAKIVKVLK